TAGPCTSTFATRRCSRPRTGPAISPAFRTMRWSRPGWPERGGEGHEDGADARHAGAEGPHARGALARVPCDRGAAKPAVRQRAAAGPRRQGGPDRRGGEAPAAGSAGLGRASGAASAGGREVGVHTVLAVLVLLMIELAVALVLLGTWI